MGIRTMAMIAALCVALAVPGTAVAATFSEVAGGVKTLTESAKDMNDIKNDNQQGSMQMEKKTPEPAQQGSMQMEKKAADPAQQDSMKMEKKAADPAQKGSMQMEKKAADPAQKDCKPEQKKGAKKSQKSSMKSSSKQDSRVRGG